jgi:hypothetical protein
MKKIIFVEALNKNINSFIMPSYTPAKDPRSKC